MQPVIHSNVVPAPTVFKTVIKPSEAFNRCGIRNYLLYLPAFKPGHERTVDNAIPHWTDGLQSFFIVPKQITYEWFCELVREINEINLENGANPATHFVKRDGDSFIQNVLIPNVEQVCQNVCVPRGNLDGSLIEMFMAGANMVTSEPIMNSWQALVKETISTCSFSKKEKKLQWKKNALKIQRVTVECVTFTGTIPTVEARAPPIAAAIQSATLTLIRTGNNV